MAEKTLMKGNEALAEAALRAGCKCFFGYPITPQTEIAAYLSKRMPKVGGTFLQAESEVAAINMIYGCAGSGIRCMTSSSSPGISLKTEGISYIAGADLPCVIINVQRGGPGLGGIQPSQSDYWQVTHALGHGDFHALVFAPASVQEMADTVTMAFDRADKYRMPAVILADGLLGQMMEPVAFEDAEIVLSDASKKPWAANGHGNKRKHNIINSLFLQPAELEAKIRERFERYETVKANETIGVAENCDDAEIVVVAYGSTARLAKSAAEQARAEGIKAGVFRPVTLWPFPVKELNEACKTAKKVLTVEMSMGQMVDDVRLALDCRLPVEFFGRTGGVIPSPAEIRNKIKEMGGNA
ncbi:MAG: 3-methyl-2-oxobutanoate dehydrogenase subunit VorB [Bacteroides sp.]|nr:3-methyl-2-oxobutanoate dehydrogenase subunit VorB [Roseburia sp.]MCM1461396.1 3-methyl-2-oxobutanoate dehydrogenase subunit VorB [Bacteroides sp.]